MQIIPWIKDFPINSKHIIILLIQNNEKQNDIEILSNLSEITNLERNNSKPIYQSLEILFTGDISKTISVK